MNREREKKKKSNVRAYLDGYAPVAAFVMTARGSQLVKGARNLLISGLKIAVRAVMCN